MPEGHLNVGILSAESISQQSPILLKEIYSLHHGDMQRIFLIGLAPGGNDAGFRVGKKTSNRLRTPRAHDCIVSIPKRLQNETVRIHKRATTT